MPDDDPKLFEVDTTKVRAYATFLTGESDKLDQPITDVGAITITPGDPAIIPGAKTLTTAVTTASTQVKGFMETLRTDLDTLSTNTLKVAEMYDSTNDKNRDTAKDVAPLINTNR